jgi:hypothetical protein
MNKLNSTGQVGTGLKNFGMALAFNNEPQEWREKFFYFAVQFACKHQQFKVEDLRADFVLAGNALPHCPNVWGSIGREIAARGIGAPISYVKAVSPRTRAHPVILYRSLKFNQTM